MGRLTVDKWRGLLSTEAAPEINVNLFPSFDTKIFDSKFDAKVCTGFFNSFDPFDTKNSDPFELSDTCIDLVDAGRLRFGVASPSAR